ncbi:hypothetical protein JOD01_000407 [Brevibacillus fulvus]|uniref:Uncharacterized protein n=1 Tax=Brevibacillus fulvus TaxID=1125967 RepID=A0A938XVQ0_9BACL|nr:hypothetical protein [Brevibacillus fulvus]
MAIWILIIGVHLATVVFGLSIWIFYKKYKDLL